MQVMLACVCHSAHVLATEQLDLVFPSTMDSRNPPKVIKLGQQTVLPIELSHLTF